MSDLFESYLVRLKSQDANDRVKAASDLGEVGTPEVGPALLEAVWQDEASTVKQMAIQSYAEVMKGGGLEEIIKVIETHPDEYVILYAINLLGDFTESASIHELESLLRGDNDRKKATAIRAAIHANAKDLGPSITEIIHSNHNPIVLRNAIEAAGLWQINEVRDNIQQIYQDSGDEEMKTIALFSLASLGSQEHLKRLETDDIDGYMTVSYDGKKYRGREGLLNAVQQITGK